MIRLVSITPAMAVLLLTVAFALAPSAPAEAQCLDRTACREIRAEMSDLRPDLRAARQRLQRLQQALEALPRGSERWLAKRSQAKRAEKIFRKLKHEFGALKQDFRYQGCATC